MKALITGASSGIGRDMARVLAGQGCELILTARRAQRLGELRDTLPVKTEVLPFDLSREEDCRELYARCRGAEVDILINDAGFGIFGPFDETDPDRELEMLAVNIRATHLLTKLFLPDFKRRDAGYILNVSSSAAFLPGPLLSSYYASKAYVLHLTLAVREELRRCGSRVYLGALCPGPVSTEFDRTAGVRFSLPSLPSEAVAAYAVRQMFRRKGVIVPGAGMKALHFLTRLAPEEILARVAYRAQKRKQG